MNKQIKNIVEEFDFNALTHDIDMSDTILSSIYNSIFKKLGKNHCDTSCLTKAEKKYFDLNVQQGYRYKYKTSTYNIKRIVHNASLSADEMKEYEILDKVDRIPTKDLNWLDVSDVKQFNNMFNYVYGAFDISKWDVSKGTSFYAMFESAILLTDISDWDVSHAKTFADMFEYSRVNVGDLSKWDTHNVESLDKTFANAFYNIPGIENWDVSNVRTMDTTFSNSHFNGDLSKWNVSKVSNMNALFTNSDFNNDSICNWDVSNVTDTVFMFANTLFDLDLSKWDFKQLRNMSGMFMDSSFSHDISMWNLPKVTGRIDVFRGCPMRDDYKPKYPVKEDVNFNDIKDNDSNFILEEFYNKLFDKILHILDFSYLTEEEKRMYRLNIKNGCPYKYKVKDNNELQKIIDLFDKHVRQSFRIVDVFYMPLNLNWLDVSNVWDMSQLFTSTQLQCDISEWDVSNVTRMYEMFADSDFDGDISKWDISKVVDTTRMFYQSQFTGDLSSWDVSNVPEKDDMFFGCLISFEKYPKMQ